MVDGAKGRVSCTLPNGNRLPWHAYNVDAIKAREQHGKTRVHNRKAVVVIVYVYPNNVLASWINTRVIKVPSNRTKVADDIEKPLGDDATTSVAAIFDQITVEQDHWEDEVLDDEVVELMNLQFECFVSEVEIM